MCEVRMCNMVARKAGRLLLILSIVLINFFNSFGQVLNNNPGFEDGTWKNNYRPSAQNTDDAVVEVVTNPKRSGNYSFHIQHQYITGSTHNRCEVRPLVDFGADQIGYIPWHKEIWVGFSVYLKDWSKSLGPWNSILQFHGVPHNYEWSTRGTSANSLFIVGNDGFTDWSAVGEPHVGILVRVLDNPYDPTPPDEGAMGPVPIPPWWLPIGQAENKWIDIVGNFVISPDSDGKMRWWVNGRLVIDQRGPNTYYNDLSGAPAEPVNLVQLGSYKSPANTNLVNTYYDEIRWGGPNSSYSDVAPRGDVEVNSPPVLAPIGSKSVLEGASLNVNLSSTDPEGDARTFSLSPGLDFVTLTDNGDGTGTLRLAPKSGDAGSYNLTITVTDSKNNKDSETIAITVNSNNQGNADPVLSPIGNKSLQEGDIINVQLSASDADGDAITYSVSPALTFVTLSDYKDGTGRLRLAPVAGQAGTYSLTVKVTDPNNGSDSETISIKVNPAPPPNSAPVLSSIGNKTLTEGNVMNVQLTATDDDGDQLSFSVSPILSFVSLTDNGDGTGRLRLAPVFGQAGTYNLTVSVADPNDGRDSETFTITVNQAAPQNSPPVLESIGNKTTIEGSTLSIALSATDVNGGILAYSVSPSLNFAALSDNGDGTAILRLSPVKGDAGTYNVTITVTDDNDAKDSEAITLTVNELVVPNTAPVLSAIGNKTVIAGQTLNVNLKSTDVDGDALNYSLSRELRFATFTDNGDGTAVIRLSPVDSDVGRYSVTITVYDDKNSADSESISIYVEAVNTAPVLASIGNIQIAENESLNIPLSSNDPDGDPLR